MVHLPLLGSDEEVREAVQKALKSMRAFNAFFHGGLKDSMVGTILNNARDASLYLLESREKQLPNNIQIVAPPPTDYPQRLQGDELSLLLILITLLDNACNSLGRKASSGRSITDPVIRITARQEDGRLVITVQDAGSGVDPGLKRNIRAFFKDPLECVLDAMAKGERVSGLILSSLLAKRERWDLRLTSSKSRTTFEVVIIPKDGIRAQRRISHDHRPTSPQRNLDLGENTRQR
jgi:sensor histidine kinase regulating citrate/malate metabolism